MPLPTFLFGNLGTKYPYCVKVVSKFPPQKSSSGQSSTERTEFQKPAKDTTRKAMPWIVPLRSCFFRPSSGGRYIYICPRYGVENRCMIIKDNVIAYQNASCHIHNQQNISISYCHHFKYIQTSKSLFGLQTLTTFFPKISSSVTWPHAPRFHATRWIQKSWRQWRDVRPLFEARSWHVGT